MRKFVLGLILILVAGTVCAEEGPQHLNQLGLFLGAAYNNETAVTDFSLGIEYEYALAEPIGLGLFAERVFSESGETLLGIPVSYTMEHLQLFIAPAVMLAQGAAVEPAGEASSEYKFLFRIGAGYEFEVAGASLAPKINIDIAENEMSIVPGIGVGFGF